MFSPKAKTTRPGGKAAGYDYSQRACGPSDTSQESFFRAYPASSSFFSRRLPKII